MLKISVVILCIICVFICVSSLPHCEKTEIPQRLLAKRVINVIYTMESSCKMCLQQASRLPRLKRYLERKGIKTHFTVGVSHRADRLWGLVPRVQVNSRHIWRALGEQNDHFYIVDRCGRLVYEVISPWSNLNFTFVKAAVATTAHNHPCGLCPEDYMPVPEEEEIQEFPALDLNSQTVPEGATPLRLNVKLRHRHVGDPNIYKYIIRIAGLPNYHGHHPHDRETSTSSNAATGCKEIYEPQSSSSLSTISNQRVVDDSSSSTTRAVSESKLSQTSTRTTISESSSSTEHSTETGSSPLILLAAKTAEDETRGSSKEYSTIRRSEAYTPSYASIEYTSDSQATLSSIINGSTENRHVESVTANLETSNSSENKGDQKETTEYFKEEYSESASRSSVDNSDSYEPMSEDYQNTEDVKAEVRNLKFHYGRILDWLDFVSDDYEE